MSARSGAISPSGEWGYARRLRWN